MKTQLTAILLVALSATAVAQTQVPNTFQAGQTARAADVNANFDTMETAVDQVSSRVDEVNSRVDSVNSRLTSVEGVVNGSGECEAPGPFETPHKADLSPTPLSPGTEVTFQNGRTATMYRIPFVDHGNGGQYFIDIPLTLDFSVTLSTTHVNSVPDTCYEYLIQNYPAHLDIWDRRDISFATLVRDNNGTQILLRYANYSTFEFGSLQIKVEETLVKLEFSTAGQSQGNSYPSCLAFGALPPNCLIETYDQTDDVDFNLLTHPDETINSILEFIGYITVAPIP